MSLWATLLFAITLHLNDKISCSRVERIVYGRSIDSNRGNLFNTFDYFTNLKGDQRFCTERKSDCAYQGCKVDESSMCRCWGNHSFINFKEGCISDESFSVKSGQNCELHFAFAAKSVVPAFKDNHNDLSIASGISLTVKDSGKFDLFHDIETQCTAKDVKEVTANGDIKTVDENIKQSFFEVQATYTAFSKVQNLRLNDMTYSRWKKIEGKLISLAVNCSLNEQIFSTCILFKVNGSIAVDTTTTPSVKPATTPKKGVATRNATISPLITQSKDNGTLISVTEKKSVSVIKIVGAIIGVLLVILILVIIFCIWKRKSRSISRNSKRSSCKDEENASQGIALCSIDNEPQDVRESSNPYYAVDSGISDGNHYYNPGAVLKGSLTAEENNIYYSSADVVEEEKGKGVSTEYSYARSNNPIESGKGAKVELKQSMRNNPGSREDVSIQSEERYQTLTSNHSAEQKYQPISENPIYTSKKEAYQTPAQIEKHEGEPAYLALMGDGEYQAMSPCNEAVYESPMIESGYVDMKGKEEQTGEYMYAGTAVPDQ